VIRRFPTLFYWIALELLEVGTSMLTGDYWKEPPPWENLLPEGTGMEPDLGSWE
jgi:hypothetical protein